LIGRRLREGSGVKDSRSGRGKKESGEEFGMCCCCCRGFAVVEIKDPEAGVE